MAEGGSIENKRGTMPQRGKVKQARQEWAVHEDGAFAYQLQNQEIDRHYGFNRSNRRTVREDIPIAKVVQTDEEVYQQETRFQELQVLRAQAEEDERVAKKIMEQEQIQTQAHKMAVELTDEEFAKSVQEKEKEKYKRYLEKKKQHKLKKEREQIEKDLQQTTEEARIAVPPPGNSGSSEDLDQGVEEMHLQGRDPSTRVTPGGRIEDEGDFSDFYNLPNNLDPAHRLVLQELQDEELAQLIQDQEHKRSKAEVDRVKLKEIEAQDKRLAQIIQEQEKLKLRKAKQKQKQREEAKRAQKASQRPPALPPRNADHDHRRFRRDSFIGALENGPNETETNTAPTDGYMAPMEAAAEQRLQSSGEHRSTTRIGQSHSNSNIPTARKNSREQQQNMSNVSRQSAKSVQNRPKDFRPEYLPTQDAPDVERWLAGQGNSRGRLRSDPSEHLPDSPESPPGSYHSDESFPNTQHQSRAVTHNASYDTGSHYAVSEPLNFNIATAIDPTYTRQQRGGGEETTERKQPIHRASRSMPVEEHLQLEWDPNVRGSIRKGTLGRDGSLDAQPGIDRTMNSMSSRENSFQDDMGGIPPFAPVQGQRRSGEKVGRKSRKQSSQSPGPKDKGNCKQQ